MNRIPRIQKDDSNTENISRYKTSCGKAKQYHTSLIEWLKTVQFVREFLNCGTTCDQKVKIETCLQRGLNSLLVKISATRSFRVTASGVTDLLVSTL
jgi:hypothetical protein